MLLYNNKSDIWALGCILHEITTTRKAFVSDWEVYECYRSGCKLKLTAESCSSWLVHHGWSAAPIITDLIEGMLQVDYTKRPSAKELAGRFRSMYEHEK
jgi:serine/threonine protein kinase